MLNYIWLGLVAIGILTAVGNDVNDEVQNSYRNGQPIEATFVVSKSPGGLRAVWEGELHIPGAQFAAFYALAGTVDDVRQPVAVSLADDGTGTFLFAVGDATPAIWKAMARSATTKDNLTGEVVGTQFSNDRSYATMTVVVEPIRFVKLKAVTQAAFDFANTAVQIAIGLIGIMALWLGLIKVAEEAGFVRILTRMLTPVTKRLFPDIPSDHPAVGAMIMNIAANMLGLSNAATPMGLKAMEELNKLNTKVGTATNAMCTFLVINTSGLVLIPATAIAVRAAAGSANPGIIIGTSIFGAMCATVAGLIAVKLLQRLPRYRVDRESNPASEKEAGHG